MTGLTKMLSVLVIGFLIGGIVVRAGGPENVSGDPKVPPAPDVKSALGQAPSVRVSVPGKPGGWVGTGLEISVGDTLQISATGSIRFDTAGRIADPDGMLAASPQPKAQTTLKRTKKKSRSTTVRRGRSSR